MNKFLKIVFFFSFSILSFANSYECHFKDEDDDLSSLRFERHKNECSVKFKDQFRGERFDLADSPLLKGKSYADFADHETVCKINILRYTNAQISAELVIVDDWNQGGPEPDLFYISLNDNNALGDLIMKPSLECSKL